FRPAHHGVIERETARDLPREQTDRYQSGSAEKPETRPSEHRSAPPEREPQSNRGNPECTTGGRHDEPDRSIQMLMQRAVAAEPRQLAMGGEQRENHEPAHSAHSREHAEQDVAPADCCARRRRLRCGRRQHPRLEVHPHNVPRCSRTTLRKASWARYVRSLTAVTDVPNTAAAALRLKPCCLTSRYAVRRISGSASSCCSTRRC